MLVKCRYCGKKIRRGRRYSESHDCFCSCRCHTLFMNMVGVTNGKSVGIDIVNVKGRV